MITQKHKELAQRAMKMALKNGCQEVRVSIFTEKKSSFEYRDDKLDNLNQATENNMQIELFVDKRYGSFSTNRLNEKELEKFIKNGILSTRYLAEDPLRQLPHPDRYYKGYGEGLNVFDSQYVSVTSDKKIALTKDTVGEVYGKDVRIISVSSEYSDSQRGSYIINSNGFEGRAEQTSFSLFAETSLKGEGDARPSSYWYDSSIFWDQLIKKDIGKTALKRTIQKLGQKPISSGKYAMLIDHMQISRLLSPLIAATYGHALQQKNSFLVNKIGEKITSSKFTLIDDPHIPGAVGARWFDGEGVATQKRPIIESGTLRLYFIDTYIAGKMKIEPTIQSPSVLTCVHGDKNFEQLKQLMQNGIWVTGFNGGNSNSTTGDFSFGIEGFLIKNGDIHQPINEMNITGNLLTLWQHVVEIGNDPRMNVSWRIPSVLFDDVSFSGKD